MQLRLNDDFSCHTFPSLCEKLYLKEGRADVHFVFNSDDDQCIRIPAHKFILSLVSEVFCTMFNGSWIECSKVEIVDASVDAFTEFHGIIYLAKGKVTIKM